MAVKRQAEPLIRVSPESRAMLPGWFVVKTADGFAFSVERRCYGSWRCRWIVPVLESRMRIAGRGATAYLAWYKNREGWKRVIRGDYNRADWRTTDVVDVEVPWLVRKDWEALRRNRWDDRGTPLP